LPALTLEADAVNEINEPVAIASIEHPGAPAFPVIDGVDAERGETRPGGIAAAQIDDALSVLAPAAPVADQEQPLGPSGVVQPGGDTNVEALLFHGPER
jgi:hypothetical protein